ncbi:MAG: hypothetical protein ACLQVI_32370 [Polyangiaceae bacterium]|jgi:hypothetical protein
MNPGVTQVMFGLLCLVGGILIIKGAESGIGWLVFVAGIVIGCAGGIRLSQSGAKEVGN